MKTLDIVDAVNARLVEKWPERTVYLDVCPIDFDRPSFWIQVTQDERTDASRYAERHRVRITLTLFDETDEHYETSWQRLAGDADTCLGLFGGVLSVGKRRLKAKIKSLPREPDRAVIYMDFDFMTQREEDDAARETADTLRASVYLNGKKILQKE